MSLIVFCKVVTKTASSSIPQCWEASIVNVQLQFWHDGTVILEDFINELLERKP